MNLKEDESDMAANTNLSYYRIIRKIGAGGLAWSPDGAEVLFCASIGGNYTIFAVTLDGKRRIADQSPGGLILQAKPDAENFLKMLRH